MLYCNGGVPPVPFAVITPLFAPQETGVVIAETDGPEVLVTVTKVAPMQPFASFAKMV